ncbi:excinuclease ABC subunit UvrA [Rickettsiales endosymbiont of Stachyamoeba lipophora]|uniref:excinuclease ABC subunit UvrA n=1 Tax=Rickettsiales endosymbiont of Stachyamoeba lipophora TaxID=2486578 RepID=UPI000F652DC8|nr:excinuclease ABC subunit UvrA [Rickettsiales endosymbiont of Stachyamoeba lipophora]AZL15495.1 excinuclease ABC subunit UvrA [Rickettsiales endosymbiont of Stachyamoeba lipophora]
MEEYISVRGAKQHNLKNISIDIPRNKLIVITGVSGSGKSSLAFDTIYAEGQRRYVESLSAYARQFLQLQDKPDVESISGLSPAIAIDQKTISKNPRSTVGTITEIYDYMRLLYARVGVPYSPATGLPIESQTVTQMVDIIKALPHETKIYLMAPIARGQKGEFRKEFLQFKKQGFQRIKIDGEITELDEIPTLDKKKKHNIEVIVDRLVMNEELGNRLADSIETALKLSNGLIEVEIVELPEGYEGDKKIGDIITLSERFSCPVSGFQIAEIEPRLFSFNSPYGACTSCDGIGKENFFDPELIVPKPSLSLKEGAIAPWAENMSRFQLQTLENLSRHYDFDIERPFKHLPDKIKNIIFFGSGTEEIEMTYTDGIRKQVVTKPFEGLVGNIDKRYKEADDNSLKEELEKYQSTRACQTCNGYRLKQEALCIKINDLSIGQVCRFTIGDMTKWFETLPEYLNGQQNQIAEKIIKEIGERLQFLQNVGLDYLTLSRESGTLSGGESQRIRLASQIGSGLTGVLYVLDEPSIGLHQSDNTRLISTLKNLRDLQNTVIVVEHDEETMMAADYLVDVGPGAGVYGGQIISQGTPQEVANDPNSVTGQYLKGLKYIEIPTTRRQGHPGKFLILEGARSNNLHNCDIKIPLGTFCAVTGVSGGGKSTLIIHTLYKAAIKNLEGAKAIPGEYDRLSGLESIDKIIDINQSPIGRTPRSNPATYTGAFGPIRDWYVALPESKARGYKPGRFSFNVKGGRCETCQGDGVIKIEMHFLPDVYVKCDACQGERYNRETLEIKYKGKSIADVLSMTVDVALEFFDKVPLIKEKMVALKEVGLGYIKIGQSATTLSGGEAQRVKLAKELSRRSTGKTLYILDEPTTGLHSDDIKKLLHVLHQLVELGNTVLVIEHNLDVVKTADHVIDVGPGGGDKGGYIVASCTPEELIEVKESITGQYLRNYLVQKGK